MQVARNRGRPTPSCSSGLQRKELAARVYCMRCNNGKLDSTEWSRSSGPSLGRLAKTRSRFGNCFRIRQAFALWISALTCSITAGGFGGWGSKGRFWGGGGGGGVLRGRLLFFFLGW